MGNNNRQSKNVRNNRNRKNGNRKKVNKRDQEPEYIVSDCEGSNDPSWYAGSPEILKDVASLSYFVPTGGKFQIDTDDASEDTILGDQSIPGLMTIEVVQGPGKTEFTTDAANVASRILYTQINSMNSRNKSYDPADLFLDILAVDDMYGFISWAKRIYGLVNTYSIYNQYYPREVVRAMKVDFDDILKHLPDFRVLINNWILQLGTFVTPQGWNYLARHQFLYTNIYADSPSAKAQTYAFIPYGFRKYVETEGPGKLVMMPLGYRKASDGTPILLTYDTIKQYGDELLKAIATSQDCTTMAADIIKATNAFMTEDMLQPDYCIAPVYVPEVLMQIENATIHNWLKPANPTEDSSRFDILTNVAGNVVYDPKALVKDEKYDMYTACKSKLLNMRMDNATPEMNMVATRLMSCAQSHGAGWYVLDSFGTEIVLDVSIVYFTHCPDKTGMLTWQSKTLSGLNYATLIKKVKDLPDCFRSVHLINQFAWHPTLIYRCDTLGANDDTAQPKGMRIMETDNITVVTREDLKKMHDAALLGEFQIGQSLIKSK